MYNQFNSSADWVAEVEKIATRHEDRLFRTAVVIMGEKADAEDIVQDVFVTLFEKKPHFESQEHEIAWLMRVTVNLCKSRLRSYWWKNTEPLLDTYPAQSNDEQDIMQTVLSLPKKYRIVIYLFYYEVYQTQKLYMKIYICLAMMATLNLSFMPRKGWFH